MSHALRDNAEKNVDIPAQGLTRARGTTPQHGAATYALMKRRGEIPEDPTQRRAEEWQRQRIAVKSEAQGMEAERRQGGAETECWKQEVRAKEQDGETVSQTPPDAGEERQRQLLREMETARLEKEARLRRRQQIAEALREPVLKRQEPLPKIAQTATARPGEQFGYFHNGRKGEAYLCEAKFPAKISDCVIRGLEPFGLKYRFKREQHVCQIYGTPLVAGEAILDMTLSVQDGERAHEVQLKRSVTFNPDPRDLWKDIPTPTDIEYYKPDCDACRIICESQEGAPRHLVAVSRRGRSHAHAGKPRDDHFKVDYVTETGWFFLSVADGAGSASCARKGAELACLTVHEQICPHLAELDALFLRYAAEQQAEELKQPAAKLAYDLLSRAVWEARQSILKEAQRTGRDSKEYATTLMLVLCKPFSFGWVFACYSVGDGAMAVLGTQDGKPALRLLSEPDEGEFSGQTCFLTMSRIFQGEELHKRITVHFVQEVKALLLMTDGISDARFEGDAALHSLESWEALWQELERVLTVSEGSGKEEESLLDWLLFWSQGNHDDRTIALVY